MDATARLLAETGLRTVTMSEITQKTGGHPVREFGHDTGNPPAVEVRELVRVYPCPVGGSLRALDGVSFDVQVREFFGFPGPNGAGKTTALEIIEGSRKPTSGQIRVLGIDPPGSGKAHQRPPGALLGRADYRAWL